MADTAPTAPTVTGGDAPLRYPPIPADFLRVFGTNVRVDWVDESVGRFRVVVLDDPSSLPTPTPTPSEPPPAFPLPVLDIVVETPSALTIPEIPEERRCREPPSCHHGRPTVQRTVQKTTSVNIGRTFYTCAWPEGKRCGFFRWLDEMSNFSEMTFRAPLTAKDVRDETRGVDGSLQLRAWEGIQQGTEDWHRLRACRVTASNFGSVHHNNAFCTPWDLLRSLLWPTSYDSCVMRYGSVNEPQAASPFWDQGPRLTRRRPCVASANSSRRGPPIRICPCSSTSPASGSPRTARTSPAVPTSAGALC